MLRSFFSALLSRRAFPKSLLIPTSESRGGLYARPNPAASLGSAADKPQPYMTFSAWRGLFGNVRRETPTSY